MNVIKKYEQNAMLPTGQTRSVWRLIARSLLTLCILLGFSFEAVAALPDNQGIYQPEQADLTLKVKNGEIVIKHSYFEGVWYPNLNWVPIKITYDSFDNSVKSITRSHTDYDKVAPGVFQDKNYNTLREIATGFRWSDPKGNWIEYSAFGEVTSYGNRNGLTATFQYSGTTATGTTGVPASAGHITGILDASGKQAMWFEYTGNDLTLIRDRANRTVLYPRDVNHQLSGYTDGNGNTWTYKVAVDEQVVTYTDPNGNTKTYITTYLRFEVTDPDGHTTSRTTFNNGAPFNFTRADGSATTTTYDYDKAKGIFYTRETTAGRVVETWSELKQDLNRGEFLRRDVNGVTVAKQSLDPATRTTTYTDARGLNTAVTKDQWGNITKTVYPDGSTVSTQYDAAYGNVIQRIDENGVVGQYSYDAKGNLIKGIEAVGLAEQRIIEYTYDADGQRISETRKGDANTPDAVTQYAWDNDGNVITVTDAEGGITRYTYDALGNPLTMTDARGKLWKRTYDNRGRLLSVTDPLNRTTTIAYNKAGLPISLTDAANNISTLGFDAAGRLLTVTDPYGAKTSYTYNAAGFPISITDAENHTQKQEYDADGRIVKLADGNGNVTQFVYGDVASGLNGLLTKVIYPTLSQDLQYDQRDRITSSTDTAAGSALALDGAPSQTTKNQYDAKGNLTVVTDPANRSTATRYNAHGEVTQTTDPANGTTQYGYDARGNLVSVTDAKGNTHRFEYDRLDRMVKEIRPLGQTIAYAYDANDNLVQVTAPKGQVKKYTYDAANRRIQENHYLTTGIATPVKTINFTYNTLDRLTSYDDGNTIGTYTYDARQLRQTGESVNYGSFTLATSTTYNALGQKTAITYPDGAQYSYTYDANKQLSTVNFPTGFGSITFNSYLWTVPSQITLPGGTVRTQSFDGLLRLKDFSVKDPGQSQVLSYQYNYDLTNNIVAKATEAGATNYSYDTLDRLTGATYTGSSQTNEAYTYDQLANRLTDSRTTAAWTYNENNQLISADNLSYTYDANGNTISQTDSVNVANTRNYVYDIDNRLIEVRDAGNTLIAAFSYDPFGRRLSKDTGSSKTYYLYNAEGLIAEADATGQITKSYGYAPGSAFSTNPLWLKTGTAYYTYQNDHLGTPMKLLSQSGGTVWSATYDAFGNATVDPASTVTNNLRYPGQYADAETGLHYNWMRYYDPKTGRYRTGDPIGLWGGINLYAYVDGRPQVFIDPTGEFWNLVGGAAIGAVGDIAIQMVMNGMRFECIKWESVLIAATAGALNPYSSFGGLGSILKGEVAAARSAKLRAGSRAAKRTMLRAEKNKIRGQQELASWALVEEIAELGGNLVPDDKHIRINNNCEKCD